MQLAAGEYAFLETFCIPESAVGPRGIRSDVHGKDESQRLKSKEQQGLRYLFLMWTLKEAYTKALGLGLGFDFRRIECKVTLDDSTENIYLQVDGMQLREWEFLTWRMRSTDADALDDETYQLAVARHVGYKGADDSRTLGRVIDHGLVSLQPAHLDTTLDASEAWAVGSSSVDPTVTAPSAFVDKDGQQKQQFGPSSVGSGCADGAAAVPPSSYSPALEAELEVKLGKLGMYADGDLRIQLYDALTIINMVSVLSSGAGSVD